MEIQTWINNSFSHGAHSALFVKRTGDGWNGKEYVFKQKVRFAEFNGCKKHSCFKASVGRHKHFNDNNSFVDFRKYTSLPLYKQVKSKREHLSLFINSPSASW